MKRALVCLSLFSSLSAVAANSSEQISKAAESLRPKLIETRRDIHRNPELANREGRTATLVATRLRQLGFNEIRTNMAHHGVVGLLKGGKPGPTVAIRADMDALPFNEVHEVSYKSAVSNVMHACGHDAHTAIGLGVAEVLSKMRSDIPGTVKFIFEPAEEGAPAGEEGGARLLIKEGALEEPRPGAIYGLHVTPELAVGKIGYHSGPAQAALDTFEIVVHGKEAFAATPEKGVDAIAVAAQCVTTLIEIPRREATPTSPLILTVGTIRGGEKKFGVATEVKMEGCLRTLSETTRAQTQGAMRHALHDITVTNGATFELRFTEITAVVNNDPALMQAALPVIRSVVGSDNVIEVSQRLGGEDFSYFQQVAPGILFRLGCGNEARGITAQIHTPEFDLDEDCLVVGVKTLATVALNYLNTHPAPPDTH